MVHEHTINCIEKDPRGRIRCKFDPPTRAKTIEQKLTVGVVISDATPEFIVRNHNVYLSEAQRKSGYLNFRALMTGMSTTNLDRLKRAMISSHFDPAAITITKSELKERRQRTR